MRQASLTKYLPTRKTRNPKKTIDGGTHDALLEPELPFPGLYTQPVAQSAEPVVTQQPERTGSLLQEGFVVPIKLEATEERLVARFKYMYEAAVKRLSSAPPFPTGVQPFDSSMLEVQLDSTTSHAQHLNLQQAICAGHVAAQVYFGESQKLPLEAPEWAKLPNSLPGTFLRILAEFLLRKSILLVVPGASLNDLCRLSGKLRSLGIPTKYTSEPVPWSRVNHPETWLVNYDDCPDAPRNCFDGVILPQGAPKWSGLPCGTLHTEIDPEFANLSPRRTVFVDFRLEKLVQR